MGWKRYRSHIVGLTPLSRPLCITDTAQLYVFVNVRRLESNGEGINPLGERLRVFRKSVSDREDYKYTVVTGILTYYGILSI